MFRKFKFEEALYEALQDIPYSVRQKIDLAGLRLTTEAWRRLPPEERGVLCHISVRSQGEREVYRAFLILALSRLGLTPEVLEAERLREERARWEDPLHVPEEVAESSSRAGLPVAEDDWLMFDDTERYVLFRVSQEKPERVGDVLMELLKHRRWR
jgi:hypothetical protein